MNAPPLAVTLGDASGVGPEIALKAAQAGLLHPDCVVYGDLTALNRANELLNLSVPIHVVASPQSTRQLCPVSHWRLKYKS